MSNFSLSRRIFKRLVIKTGKNAGLFTGKELTNTIIRARFPVLLQKHTIWTSPFLSLFSLTPFPNKPWFLHVCHTSLLKTLWEKEKLLVTSNFSFFHNVSYHFHELFAIFMKFEIVVCKLFQFGREENLSFGKGLTHSHTMTPFDTPGKQAISPLPSVFYLFREVSGIFIKFKIVVCRLFQFGPV